jgi:hypothetical protein
MMERLLAHFFFPLQCASPCVYWVGTLPLSSDPNPWAPGFIAKLPACSPFKLPTCSLCYLYPEEHRVIPNTRSKWAVVGGRSHSFCSWLQGTSGTFSVKGFIIYLQFWRLKGAFDSEEDGDVLHPSSLGWQKSNFFCANESKCISFPVASPVRINTMSGSPSNTLCSHAVSKHSCFPLSFHKCHSHSGLGPESIWDGVRNSQARCLWDCSVWHGFIVCFWLSPAKEGRSARLAILPYCGTDLWRRQGGCWAWTLCSKYFSLSVILGLLNRSSVRIIAFPGLTMPECL